MSFLNTEGYAGRRFSKRRWHSRMRTLAAFALTLAFIGAYVLGAGLLGFLAVTVDTPFGLLGSLFGLFFLAVSMVTFMETLQ